MSQRRFPWLMVLGLLALAPAGCPSADVGDGQDTTDDGATDDDNGDSNGGDGVEPGVDIMVANEGAAHVPVGEQVTYQANPPASGSHWSQGGVAPVAPGFYETAVEEEQWLHNLEHGYVVVLYDCRGPCHAELLDDL